jgi:hypothetical protein
MSKLSRLAVLVVGLMSLFGVLSSSAGAVSWDNSGATAFTASTGPGTLTSTGVPLSCSGATATGTAPATAISLTYFVSGTVTFNGCKLSNIATVVECGYTWTGLTQDGVGMGSIITGSVDVTCDVMQFNTRCATSRAPSPATTSTTRPACSASRLLRPAWQTLTRRLATAGTATARPLT